MAISFGEKVIKFNQQLQFTGKLPPGFKVVNPYLDNPETMPVMERFYKTFYGDNGSRKLILGINPSRHGAGVTGVPFTDTKRLKSACGIEMKSAHTHEISSIFLYDVIAAYGGTEQFYSEFYINSPFPLAIVRQAQNRNWLNANYYDDLKLFNAVKGFMIDSIKKHIALGLETEHIFVLGKKNAQFITRINQKEHFFKKMTVLEHPRYIQQYKSKQKEEYIDKYVLSLKGRQSEL